MLRSLSRNALAHRSINSTPVSLAHRGRDYGYAALRFNSNSSSSPAAKSTATASGHADPTALPPLLKQKAKVRVELRPAPVKPPPLSATNIAPPPTACISTKQSSIAIDTSHESHEPLEHLLRRQHILDDFASHHLAPCPPNLTMLQSFWFTFKQLAKFYFRGIQMIWKHRMHAGEIRSRISNAENPSLTRWESRFLRIHAADMVKLTPFLLLLVFLEEIIPLIVIFAPSILPSTCILPSQYQKIQAKQDERQNRWLRVASLDDGLKRLVTGRKTGEIHLSELTGASARTLCGLLRVSTIGPDFRCQRRIVKHLEQIIADDVLLRREGMGAWLDMREVREALAERGMAPQNILPAEHRACLHRYLVEIDPVQNPSEVVGDALSRRVFWILSNAVAKKG